MTRIAVALSALCLALVPSSTTLAQRGGANAADSIKYKYPSTPKLEALKAEAAKEIDAKAKMIQEMVDQTKQTTPFLDISDEVKPPGEGQLRVV